MYESPSASGRHLTSCTPDPLETWNSTIWVCYIKLVYDHLKLVQELHPCGAETIYMDPDYLQEVVKGMLRVHVRNAVGLQLQGEKKECNAFVTVAVGPSAGQHYPPASGIEQNTALC